MKTQSNVRAPESIDNASYMSSMHLSLVLLPVMSRSTPSSLADLDCPFRVTVGEAAVGVIGGVPVDSATEPLPTSTGSKIIRMLVNKLL